MEELVTAVDHVRGSDNTCDISDGVGIQIHQDYNILSHCQEEVVDYCCQDTKNHEHVIKISSTLGFMDIFIDVCS